MYGLCRVRSTAIEGLAALMHWKLHWKFFVGVNSILAHSRGASELVKLHLMESYCYPILSYALECFSLSATYIQQLNGCWNSVYRKIFDFKPWTSVRELIQCLNRINFEHLLYQKRLCFLHNMMLCNNSVIASVIEVFIGTNEYANICDFACVTPSASKSNLRQSIVTKFINSNAG